MAPVTAPCAAASAAGALQGASVAPNGSAGAAACAVPSTRRANAIVPASPSAAANAPPPAGCQRVTSSAGGPSSAGIWTRTTTASPSAATSSRSSGGVGGQDLEAGEVAALTAHRADLVARRDEPPERVGARPQPARVIDEQRRRGAERGDRPAVTGDRAGQRLRRRPGVREALAPQRRRCRPRRCDAPPRASKRASSSPTGSSARVIPDTGLGPGQHEDAVSVEARVLRLPRRVGHGAALTSRRAPARTARACRGGRSREENCASAGCSSVVAAAGNAAAEGGGAAARVVELAGRRSGSVNRTVSAGCSRGAEPAERLDARARQLGWAQAPRRRAVAPDHAVRAEGLQRGAVAHRLDVAGVGLCGERQRGDDLVAPPITAAPSPATC